MPSHNCTATWAIYRKVYIWPTSGALQCARCGMLQSPWLSGLHLDTAFANGFRGDAAKRKESDGAFRPVHTSQGRLQPISRRTCTGRGLATQTLSPSCAACRPGGPWALLRAAFL